MNQPIRSVLVAGGGVVALAAAAGFARALPRAHVTLLPQPIAAAALADRLPLALPAGADILSRLGLDPARLMDDGIAVPRLASRFADWGAETPWLVGEGEALAHPGIALHQLWLRASEAGPVPPFHALVPACAVALAGRTLPADVPAASPLGRAAQALHLDARRLTGALAASARAAGVQVAPPGTTIASVEHGTGGVAALRLTDGARIEADLYVDATGPARRLGAARAAVESWRALLPADRLLLTSAEPVAGPIDEHRARPFGWMLRTPMATAAGFSAPADEAAARRLLGRAGADAELVTSEPGRLALGWIGNLLSLGDAAVQPGPLGQLGLPVALGQLALALDLLPGRDMEPLLLTEYNRRAGLHADRARDVVTALYVAGRRPRGPFWATAARAPVPEPLAGRLAQFARRGAARALAEESMTRDGWAAMLLGRGIRPQLADPVAAGQPAAAARELVCGMADALARLAATLPRHKGPVA